MSDKIAVALTGTLAVIIAYLFLGVPVTLGTVFGCLVGNVIFVLTWIGVERFNGLTRSMLWKRFSLFRHKCDICNKRSFIQHEVGLGYWVCSKQKCLDKAGDMAEKDLEEWQSTVLTSSNNMV